jgi:hypothetical protein
VWCVGLCGGGGCGGGGGGGSIESTKGAGISGLLVLNLSHAL